MSQSTPHHSNEDELLLSPPKNSSNDSILIPVSQKPDSYQFIIQHNQNPLPLPEPTLNENLPKEPSPEPALEQPSKAQNFGRWNEEEKQIFLSSYQKHGKDWKKIAGDIETRNSEQVRSHAQKYFARQLRMEEQLSQKMKAEYEIVQKIGRPKRSVKKVKYSDEVIEYKNRRKVKQPKMKEKSSQNEKNVWKRNVEDSNGRRRSEFLNSLLHSVERIVHG